MRKIPSKMLWLASFRFYLKHPWLLILTLLGLASGVGIVIAIDIAVSAAQVQVDKISSTLMGQATHQIVGGPAGVEQSVFVDLKLKHAFHQASPEISGYVYTNPDNPITLNLLGIESFSEINFRSFVNSSLPNEKALTNFFTTKNGILLTPNTAKNLNLRLGDSLTIYIGINSEKLKLIGYLPNDPTLTNLIVTDISNAQSIFNLGTRLTRINLRLNDSSSLQTIEKILPNDLQIITMQQKKSGLDQLTQAFRTNLQAMSLLALLIGVFVVFTTVRFSVFYRMKQFGLYRITGITGAELNQLILGEVFVLSIVASFLGLAGGALLANVLIELITQIFSDHYFDMQSAKVSISYFTIIITLMLGIFVALLTAYFPGRQAARLEIINVGQRMGVEKSFKDFLRIAIVLGLVSCLSGIVVILLSNSLTAAFIGLFLCVVGFSLLLPEIFSILSRRVTQLHFNSLPLPVVMGLRDVNRSLSRTGVALIAMVIALSSTIGVGTMVSSFRVAVSDWLNHSLVADIYVSIPDRMANPATQQYTPSQLNDMTSLKGVRDFSKGRHLTINGENGKHALMMLELPLEGFKGFNLLNNSAGNLFHQFQNADVVLVTEPFAYHQNLSIGDSINLNTSYGKHAFKIIGIYRDYGSESGKITMSQSVFEKHWSPVGVTTVGLYLEENYSTNQMIQALNTLFVKDQTISIRSSQSVRERTLAIFDRTFLITEVLRVLILIVAIITVIVSLMSWQLERRRELAISQAIGFLPGQLQLQLFSQSIFMSINAFIFAIPLGIFISAVLVHIINKRSFGWGMELAIEPAQLFYAGLSAIVAGLIAAAYPAWQVKSTSPREALQENQ